MPGTKKALKMSTTMNIIIILEIKGELRLRGKTSPGTGSLLAEQHWASQGQPSSSLGFYLLCEIRQHQLPAQKGVP